MAARKNRITHDAKTRQKIQASQIVNRLINHTLGEVEMTSTQVRAAEILLKKTLPDLSQMTIDAEVETRELKPLTEEEAKALDSKLEDEC